MDAAKPAASFSSCSSSSGTHISALLWRRAGGRLHRAHQSRPLCCAVSTFATGNNLFNVIGRGVDAALITAERRWPLGPVGMDFLERLRVVGAPFVIFDLDLDNAALPPLSGDPNDVQDIGNARPVGGFTRNACEHVRRTQMHDAKHIGAGGGARHRLPCRRPVRPSPVSATFYEVSWRD